MQRHCAGLLSGHGEVQSGGPKLVATRPRQLHAGVPR